jgi:hypothetical protein
MAAALRDKRSKREVEYAFEIKLLGLPPQASAFLGRQWPHREIGHLQDRSEFARLAVCEINFSQQAWAFVLPIDDVARATAQS